MKGTACGFCLGLPPYHGLMHTNWKTVFTSGKCERLAMSLPFQLLIKKKLGTDSFQVCRARYQVNIFWKWKLKCSFLFKILTESALTGLLLNCCSASGRRPPRCTARACQRRSAVPNAVVSSQLPTPPPAILKLALEDWVVLSLLDMNHLSSFLK